MVAMSISINDVSEIQVKAWELAVLILKIPGPSTTSVPDKLWQDVMCACCRHIEADDNNKLLSSWQIGNEIQEKMTVL